MKSKVIVTARLDEELFRKLAQTAEKEKVSKSFIIKKALELYFAQKQVDVKDIAEISTRVKELERKYYEILNRLNTLSRQMERILKMRK